jgi:hypothetical protein
VDRDRDGRELELEVKRPSLATVWAFLSFVIS